MPRVHSFTPNIINPSSSSLAELLSSDLLSISHSSCSSSSVVSLSSTASSSSSSSSQSPPLKTKMIRKVTKDLPEKTISSHLSKFSSFKEVKSKMDSIVSNKKKDHGAKPYRSHRSARKSTSGTRLVSSLPTFDKISIAGRMTFQCRYFDCKYISTQHAQLIVHQTVTHGLTECEKCSVAYFSKSEKDNCFAKHESQEIAETTIKEEESTVDHEGDLQLVIDGILEAADENLVTLAPYQPPSDSPQSTVSSLPSTSQSSSNLVYQQPELSPIKLQISFKRFKCEHSDCGRSFENEWALKSHFCAKNNYRIPRIIRLDSVPKMSINSNQKREKSKKLKSDEYIEACSTASSSDDDTDDVEKDESWIPGSGERMRSSRKLTKRRLTLRERRASVSERRTELNEETSNSDCQLLQLNYQDSDSDSSELINNQQSHLTAKGRHLSVTTSRVQAALVARRHYVIPESQTPQIITEASNETPTTPSKIPSPLPSSSSSASSSPSLSSDSTSSSISTSSLLSSTSSTTSSGTSSGTSSSTSCSTSSNSSPNPHSPIPTISKRELDSLLSPKRRSTSDRNKTETETDADNLINNRPRLCPVCHRVFKSRTAARAHFRFIHPSLTAPKNFPLASADQIDSRNTHIVINSSGHFTCEVCNIRRWRKRIVPKYGALACATCEQFFASFLVKPAVYFCESKGECLDGNDGTKSQVSQFGGKQKCKACWIKLCFERFQKIDVWRNQIRKKFYPRLRSTGEPMSGYDYDYIRVYTTVASLSYVQTKNSANEVDFDNDVCKICCQIATGVRCRIIYGTSLCSKCEASIKRFIKTPKVVYCQNNFSCLPKTPFHSIVPVVNICKACKIKRWLNSITIPDEINKMLSKYKPMLYPYSSSDNEEDETKKDK